MHYEAKVPSRTELGERASAKQPVDAHQAVKRDSDKKTLARIYAGLPRPLVNHFLNEALSDRIYYDILTEVEPAEKLVESPTFHLYDKGLWKLVRAFFAEWIQAYVESREIYHDHLNNGVATPVHTINSAADFMERRERFQQHIMQAHRAWALLNSYVRDEFPDLDLEQLDRTGVERYVEWTERLKREVAEIRESLRSEAERPEVAQKPTASE